MANTDLPTSQSDQKIPAMAGFLRPVTRTLLLVVLTGSIMTGLAAWMAHRWEERGIRSQFELRVADEVSALVREIETTLDALRSAAAFYGSSEAVFRNEFNLYARSMIERRKGLRTLEWLPLVSRDQIPAFVQKVRTEDYADFEIKPIAGGDSGFETEVFPVLFLEPFAGNEAVIGFDLASEERRRRALILARDTGQLAATPLLGLIRNDRGWDNGVIVFLAVYANGVDLAEPAARRAAVKGFMVGVVHPGEIVEDALRYLRPEDITFKVFDTTESGGAVELHSHGKPDAECRIKTTHDLNVGGRTWRVEFRSTDAYESGLQSWNMQGVILAGLLLTGLTALTLGGQMGKTNQIGREVEERTRDLQIANERLRQETEERTLAAEALRESDTRMRSILDYASSVIFIKDLQGRYMLINRRFEERFHVRNADFVGSTDFDVFPKEIAEAFQANDREVAKSGQAIEFEETALQDGEVRTYLSVKLPLLHENGIVYAVCGIATDITDRKRAELELAASRDVLEARVAERTNELRERERAMSTLLGNLPGAAYRCQNTPDWPMEFVSEGIRGLTGHGPDEFLKGGLSFGSDVVHPDDQQRIWEEVQAAVLAKVPFRLTYRISSRDGGHRWVWEQGSGVFDEAGHLGALEGFITDITPRMMAEEALRRLNEELEHRVEQRTQELKIANRELEAFSYSVSHDLRAPLRTIDGFSQALYEDYAAQLDDEGLANLQRVRAACQRMGLLIDDLLALSRVTRADFIRSPLNMSAMVHATLEFLHASQSERKAEFVVEPGMSDAGDPRLIQIALDNLLGNAWKFTGRRVFTRIEVGRASNPPNPPESVRQKGGSVYFVRDNGAGFEMQYASKLFGVFQRFHTTVEFPGTGVGLATVQRIIHRHGGEIWCESVPDLGTTFYFTLH